MLVVIETNPVPLEQLPDILSAAVKKYQQHFIASHSDDSEWFLQCLEDEQFALQLSRTWAGSQYVAELCCQQPQMFRQMVDSGWLLKSYADQQLSSLLAEQLAESGDEQQLNQRLRQFRARQMLRIIWRDLNRLADMQETTRDVTALAEACIQQALDFHYRRLCESVGTPMAEHDGVAVAQHLVVIGMGKLGAWELNLSSDIDLIFCYPDSGDTVGGNRSLSNSEFFTRLARKLIQSLDQVTADGFVFRVDMRLRPYGESGALVLSFDAMEEYYQDQGRDWERYAMIKARVVAGDFAQGQQLMNTLRPFTYRRYIDFSAIESLRSMKHMIQQEVKRRQLDNNVKLGSGGIREIEFIAQSFQLIRGGREVDLQEPRVQKVLALLAEKDYMPVAAVDQLQQAYVFLRNTEHAIQAFNDQQTQSLPDTELAQAALAFSMGYGNWDLLSEALAGHRYRVEAQFLQLIADAKEDRAQGDTDKRWSDLWLGTSDEVAALELLQDAGHEQAEEVLNRLQRLREAGMVQRLQTVARERLDRFMPLLLQAVNAAEQPSTVLLRIFTLVESVLRRTAYLVLLVENPGALQQLVILCSASPWIANQLAKYPVLLDELLDARTLYRVPEKATLRDELQQQMLRLSWHDLEAHMEALRYFKQAHQLHVCAAEVTGKLPLMKVSDYLTMIAEVVLEHVLELAWYNLVEKHGRPQRSEGVPCDKDFIIVGYGKLGGYELGHGSDLDLVFIHDAAPGLSTDGERPLDNGMFFTRLGQRMIHILTAQTPSGMLYDVDMRLRPSGESGLLVSSFTAYSNYQQKEAWTWEHQALVRARVVAGDAELGQRFEALRRQVLCEPRDPATLTAEVVAMRQKMRDHLGSKPSDQAQQFHLKQDAGGIVDIEFLVQYAVLGQAARYPELARWPDNIRILETLQNCAVMSDADAQSLIEAYKALRSATHRLALQQRDNVVAADEFLAERKQVQALWQRWLGKP
jgi:glutamate-ammonia-ligase adenylyltransferase